MSVVAVLGPGYVGLPLAVEFGKLGRTIGFDIVEDKVAKCRVGTDPSREIPDADMAQTVHAEYTSDPKPLAEAEFIIVALPVPLDGAKIPEFGPPLGACPTIGPNLKPGDREHTFTNVVEVVAGDSPATLDRVAALYEQVVRPDAHRFSSIKVAGVCKVIENTQRDLNIALKNELAIIFDKIGVDTSNALEAAGTASASTSAT